MLLEDQRFIHEDLERLEQGITDRVAEEPRNRPFADYRNDDEQTRERLVRDHQVAGFLTRIQEQSQRLLDIYQDANGLRAKEIQSLSVGDPMEEFYKHLEEIKDFHRRYPNEPVENLEKAYRQGSGENDTAIQDIENMFTGEESLGQFFDLTKLHELYLNLPGVKRLTYLQYLDLFDVFTQPELPVKRANKLTDQYFNYVGELAAYLESFIKRSNPLEPLDELFASLDTEFAELWEAKKLPGWNEESQSKNGTGPKTEGSGEGIWCPDCEKEFTNENVYKNHLKGKKHIRAAEAKRGDANPESQQPKAGDNKDAILRGLKERAVAEREHRITSLTKALKDERQATRVNVERKQGMTERERQMELDALFADTGDSRTGPRRDSDSESDSDDKVYNPLKLPLAWDGKPIPYWLYKLHGLGVEFPCEICGNFVYMGRRAFDKHFSEARHIYGLRCLGITQQTSLFREIVKIDEALRLWESLEKERKHERDIKENVVQMEDAEGNVMPERIYLDVICNVANNE
ncbi:spliceosome-associated protein [Microsporum canis CBS 113480]|uniref:Spliceosome-associated protein n=1 Tax=Arthroderma otae (strain ATCC MYA-4605 / CBS 113480) TaxID=554155 RepID=C5FHY7_ARTOC|nr:spliceosome-associated protein [Microsporum canis CBS 113480]EEQ28967.1 spliceosome-associated protein [Microsporum canis CBS 113480]